MNNTTNDDDELNWKKSIRTDLWHNMNADQLSIQQSIIMNQINLLYSMGNSNPTVTQLLVNLQKSNDNILQLIDYRMNNRIVGIV